MPYSVDMEEMEGRWIAHVPALPGCFASAETQAGTLAAAPSAILDYWVWSDTHAPLEDPVRVEPREIIRAWQGEDEYEVNAFFASDRPALTEDEVAEGLRLLTLSRADLFAAFLGMPAADMARELPGERWPVAGILRHLADGENWYLDRFGAAIESAWDLKDPLSRLILVRTHLMEVLPQLAGDARLVTVQAESWTFRKLLRRALWHERDHTAHIRQIIARLRAG